MCLYFQLFNANRPLSSYASIYILLLLLRSSTYVLHNTPNQCHELFIEVLCRVLIKACPQSRNSSCLLPKDNTNERQPFSGSSDKRFQCIPKKPAYIPPTFTHMYSAPKSLLFFLHPDSAFLFYPRVSGKSYFPPESLLFQRSIFCLSKSCAKVSGSTAIIQSLSRAQTLSSR